MPSSYSASLRFELQFTGENLNLWGDKLNAVINRTDTSIAGWLTKALTADYTLTTANGSADEARTAMLKFTGTGAFTVTIPAVSKSYLIWNACTGVLTITNGSNSVTIQSGETVAVMTDGGANIARVQPTDFGSSRLTSVGSPTATTDAATKAYVDAQAFAALAGDLPGQTGNAGKFLTTDGSVASWGDDVSGFSASATLIRVGTSTTKAMTPGDTYSALAEVTLFQNAGTIVTGSTAGTTLDMSTFINGVLTLGANATLPNPTTPKLGQVGRIRLIQDGTGSRTLTLGANWKRMGGAPALTTTAGANDILYYEVITTSLILYDVKKNPT